MSACTHIHTRHRERASKRELGKPQKCTWQRARFFIRGLPCPYVCQYQLFQQTFAVAAFCCHDSEMYVVPTLLRKAAAIFKSNHTAQTAFNRLRLPSEIIKAGGPLLMCKYTQLIEEHLITKSCGVIKFPNTWNVQLVYGCISDSVPQLLQQIGAHVKFFPPAAPTLQVHPINISAPWRKCSYLIFVLLEFICDRCPFKQEVLHKFLFK